MENKEKYKELIKNKTAHFNYTILETFEAGLKLVGSEVKSLRLKKANINDAYVVVRELQTPKIINMHISKYTFSNRFNHEELRSREILLNRNEILKLKRALKEKGLTVVVLKIYLKGGLIKAEIGLAKGKHDYDKKKSLQERDIKRDTDRLLKDFKK
jgi:SsrA-binding protein